MQNRLTHQGHELVEDILAGLLGGVDHRRQRRIRLRAPLGAEAAHNFTMDHRGPQSAFAGIVVSGHISAIQEHQQMLAMCAIARPQISSQPTDHRPRQQAVQAPLQDSDFPFQHADFAPFAEWRSEEVGQQPLQALKTQMVLVM